MIISKKKGAGFSLVELMVAMLISLILIGAAAATWLTSKKTYTLQEDLGRIQENARFALEFIKYDIRMAGYYGCANDASSVKFTATDVSALGMEGANDTDEANIRTGTDTITLRYIDPDGPNLETSMTSRNAAIDITEDNTIKEGDLVAIADCKSTDIFKVTNDPDGGDLEHTASGNSSTNLSKPYVLDPKDPVIVRAYNAVRYSIRSDDDGGAALMRNDEVLVEGIEDMQILYGEVTDNNSLPQSYVTAASDTNWSSIRSVRISLLSSSIREYGLEEDTRDDYVKIGATSFPNERRRRRAFTTTIQARNL